MFKTLLVPLDGSPLAEQALDIAAEIAFVDDQIAISIPVTAA